MATTVAILGDSALSFTHDVRITVDCGSVEFRFFVGEVILCVRYKVRLYSVRKIVALLKLLDYF